MLSLVLREARSHYHLNLKVLQLTSESDFGSTPAMAAGDPPLMVNPKSSFSIRNSLITRGAVQWCFAEKIAHGPS